MQSRLKQPQRGRLFQETNQTIDLLTKEKSEPKANYYFYRNLAGIVMALSVVVYGVGVYFYNKNSRQKEFWSDLSGYNDSFGHFPTNNKYIQFYGSPENLGNQTCQKFNINDICNNYFKLKFRYQITALESCFTGDIKPVYRAYFTNINVCELAKGFSQSLAFGCFLEAEFRCSMRRAFETAANSWDDSASATYLFFALGFLILLLNYVFKSSLKTNMTDLSPEAALNVYNLNQQIQSTLPNEEVINAKSIEETIVDLRQRSRKYCRRAQKKDFLMCGLKKYENKNMLPLLFELDQNLILSQKILLYAGIEYSNLTKRLALLSAFSKDPTGLLRSPHSSLSIFTRIDRYKPRLAETDEPFATSALKDENSRLEQRNIIFKRIFRFARI